MFTGIIKEIGILRKKSNQGANLVLEIENKTVCPKIGESVSVNGVCLTVTEKKKNGFIATVVAETRKRTNLEELPIGALLNLEPSLRMGDSVSGHFVTGHVDGVGKVLQKGLVIQFPKKIKPFIREKASLAINGVSLTIAKVQGSTVTLALIPFTEKHTNLGKLKQGDLVNIEVDILARYMTHPRRYENRHHRLAIQ